MRIMGVLKAAAGPIGQNPRHASGKPLGAPVGATRVHENQTDRDLSNLAASYKAGGESVCRRRLRNASADWLS